MTANSLTPDQQQVREDLRRAVPRGAKIHTIYRDMLWGEKSDIHIISLIYIDFKGEMILYLDKLASRLLGIPISQGSHAMREGLAYEPQEADVEEALVRQLGKAIWGNSRAFHQGRL